MKGGKKKFAGAAAAMTEASSQPAMRPLESGKEVQAIDAEVAAAASAKTESPAEAIKRQNELQEEDAKLEEGHRKEGEDDEEEEEDEEEEDCEIEEGVMEGERPKLAEGFYEIETVRKKRVRKGEAQYLIKWRGWPETANTWEPFDNLLACSDIIDAFEDSLRSGKHKSTRGRKRKYKLTTPNQSTKKQRISPTKANYNNVSAVKVRVTEEPVPMGSLSDTSPTKERSKHGNNEVRTVIRQNEEAKEQNELSLKLNELRGSVLCNEGVADKPKTHDQENNMSEMKDPVNGFPIVDNFEQSQSGRCTGAKRRKSGSVKRFKQELSKVPNAELNKTVRSSNGSCSKSGWQQDSLNPDFAGSDLGLKSLLENSNAVATITEIVRPISYSSTTIESVNDVSVTFIAMRSDGKEVVVDNKFLKVNNPLLLINFYEQHLRYSQTQTQ
ncbi:chromo domain protein LHP1-like [Impatiens glandulifera]|uniref:chromo domain protein LHP1-like n=1 Tax=Impatiens glandulifera TaxID=253017 RepID=UPI001FB0AD5D|nr:chromo domain protein LHP1-like [Impatiens glandulifera]